MSSDICSVYMHIHLLLNKAILKNKLFRSEANWFILLHLNIEAAKQSTEILNCKSSEAKRMELFQKNLLAKRSEQVQKCFVF